MLLSLGLVYVESVFLYDDNPFVLSDSMNDKYKIPFVNACIRAFAKRFSMSNVSAFNYLHRFRGVDFLDEYYEIEHLGSIDDAVDDLIILCKNNGGDIG